ncbi:MAG: hypothetical protein AAF787_10805, partial [Chloroflexota bacterium]
SAAEALLAGFIGRTFPLDVHSVQLRPSAISLNSFNGFLTLADGTRLFFKTHTESDNVIGEYYRASVLADTGYPVIQPVYSSTTAGEHLLIYEVIDDPSVFDVAWEIENGNNKHFEALKRAQNQSDDELLQLYNATLDAQNAADASEAPVHQLFHHRLTKGRLERFYGPLPGMVPADNTIFDVKLPGRTEAMPVARAVKWTINGQQYEESLDDIITRAIALLEPAQAGPVVTGHGDAHNGNVFLTLSQPAPSLLYFDPAFAGQHHPLLDLTKPLFHNVFAMWMYFPAEIAARTQIELKRTDDRWHVTHDFVLPPVREMFLESKVERVLVPVLQKLKSMGKLREDWQDYLKAALFCCPFLTMNLADSSRFPPEIALLGLCIAVEMGSWSTGQRSRIDRVLDDVAARVN